MMNENKEVGIGGLLMTCQVLVVRQERAREVSQVLITKRELKMTLSSRKSQGGKMKDSFCLNCTFS